MHSPLFFVMRYHTKSPQKQNDDHKCIYICDHPVYRKCTLIKNEAKGLAIIQQRYNPTTKCTWWSNVDSWLRDVITNAAWFDLYFEGRAKPPTDGLYPTVTVRQIMWALKIKPLKKERWETTFDRRNI